jgi:hypothetical protein
VVLHINQIQHDRARAEIEWDVLTDEILRIAFLQIDFCHPSRLDVGHANHLIGPAQFGETRVRQQAFALRDGVEIIDMRDVVDLRPGWRVKHREFRGLHRCSPVYRFGSRGEESCPLMVTHTCVTQVCVMRIRAGDPVRESSDRSLTPTELRLGGFPMTLLAS